MVRYLYLQLDLRGGGADISHTHTRAHARTDYLRSETDNFLFIAGAKANLKTVYIIYIYVFRLLSSTHIVHSE